MAKKIYTFPWDMLQLSVAADGIKEYVTDGTFAALYKRAITNPFVIVVDERDKCKRVFLTQEHADKWFAERNGEGLTPETAALEFANIDGNGTIPGTERYKMSLSVAGGKYEYGKQIMLEFTCNTADTQNDNEPTKEDIIVHFTVHNDATGDKTFSQLFNYDANTRGSYSLDITEYLSAGVNTVTMVARGRVSGLSTSAIIRVELIRMHIAADFDITQTHTRGTALSVGYKSETSGERKIEVYIDGVNVKSYDEVMSINTFKYVTLPVIDTVGVHSLQIRSVMDTYKSHTLYYEFVVVPTKDEPSHELKTTLIECEIADGSIVPANERPGLRGEQYMEYKLSWAYYASDNKNVIVNWKATADGKDITIGSRDIDDVEATQGTKPEDVAFKPDLATTYMLSAYIEGQKEPIGVYSILVVPNSLGLREAVDGLEMKLSALGRSNGEPEYVREQWTDNGFDTIFYNMDWSDLSGYTGQAVRFEGGATAINKCKPFASEKAVADRRGMAMTFDFMTKSTEDDTIPLIEIGDPNAANTAYFAIYCNKVLLRSSASDVLEYTFAENERTHLAVIVYPNHDNLDKNLMFLALNGVQAPAAEYSSTAVFEIGNSASSSTDGMIKMGDPTGKAGIDIYGIRVYDNVVTTWGLMNNCMIDKGGDVLSEFKKNNIFLNQSVDTPNVTVIRNNFRTIEVIGDLGKLETVDSATSFEGSIIYNDPINPEFNFERKDGFVKFETAGQSRLTDMMAKSFHVDLNPDGHGSDENCVTTYQNNKLTWKNRVIFAKGNTHENKVRVDMCGADSSISRNAAHFKMVNSTYSKLTFIDRPDLVLKYGNYPLRTPAMHYAYEQYSADMAKKYGGVSTDYPFPNNINIAPDSVPVVVLWHEHENDPMKVYGIGIMMEEKKASYANGNQSIYKKICEDGTLDPYDRLEGKTDKDRGWDNDGTIEMEYVRGDAFSYSSSVAGWNSETRELTFEVCFPKKSDFNKNPALKELTWNTFFNEYVKPLADTYHNQEAFDNRIEDIIWLPSFAMYYNKVMDKKCADSLCRNMHVLRGKFILNGEEKWLWYAKWWDVDVLSGLNLYGEAKMPTNADRDSYYMMFIDGQWRRQYYLSGRDDEGSMWLWDGLENNETFKDLCNAIAIGSYDAKWDCDHDKLAQDDIVNSFSMGLYNLDGLLKYLQAWRKGHDYMVRYQGSATPYRHAFLNKTYTMREALLGIGDYSKRSVSMMILGAKYPQSIRMVAASHMWFGIGLTTTPYVMGVEKSREDGEFAILLPERIGAIGKDPLHVYGANEILELDISDVHSYLNSTLVLDAAEKCQKLTIGRKPEELNGEFSVNALAFSGLTNMTRLKEFNIGGMLGITNIKDFDTLVFLEKFYAAGTNITEFKPANGAKFTTLLLPDTITTMECSNVSLGALEFYRTINTEEIRECVRMDSCPTSLLTLNLYGMGTDEGTHRLVHLWCKMLRSEEAKALNLINSARINYRNVDWVGIDKEDILTLALIPQERRQNLRGYVKCDGAFSEQEMAILIDAFGESVFDYGAVTSTLVCDCDGLGVQIAASGDGVRTIEEEGQPVIEITQGCTAYFTSVGFPIRTDSTSKIRYDWYVRLNGIPNGKTEFSNEVPFDENVFNCDTHVLETNECSNPTKEYSIYVEKYVGTTVTSGEVKIRIVARTYPVSTRLEYTGGPSVSYDVDGTMQITEVGTYVFDAKFTPTGFNGRLKAENGGVWQLTGVAENNASTNTQRTTQTKYYLSVKTLPEEDTLATLNYTAVFRNNKRLYAHIKTWIISIIKDVLTNSNISGNVPLYNCVKAKGILPAEEGGAYSSMDLKMVEGHFAPSELLEDGKDFTTFNTRGADYKTRNGLAMLKNVTSVDLQGTSVTEIVDASNSARLAQIDTENTYASIKF